MPVRCSCRVTVCVATCHCGVLFFARGDTECAVALASGAFAPGSFPTLREATVHQSPPFRPSRGVSERGSRALCSHHLAGNSRLTKAGTTPVVSSATPTPRLGHVCRRASATWRAPLIRCEGPLWVGVSASRAGPDRSFKASDQRSAPVARPVGSWTGRHNSVSSKYLPFNNRCTLHHLCGPFVPRHFLSLRGFPLCIFHSLESLLHMRHSGDHVTRKGAIAVCRRKRVSAGNKDHTRERQRRPEREKTEARTDRTTTQETPASHRAREPTRTQNKEATTYDRSQKQKFPLVTLLVTSTLRFAPLALLSHLWTTLLKGAARARLLTLSYSWFLPACPLLWTYSCLFALSRCTAGGNPPTSPGSGTRLRSVPHVRPEILDEPHRRQQESTHRPRSPAPPLKRTPHSSCASCSDPLKLRTRRK